MIEDELNRTLELHLRTLIESHRDLRHYKKGDVVQLDPVKTTNPMFRGCMLIVTEPKNWGVQGYVQGLGEDGQRAGQAYYRAETGTFEFVGCTAWIVE